MTPEERCRLISKHLDQTLSEQEESLLVRLLKTDADTARWFCELALQHARLGRLLRGRRGPSVRPAGPSFWARMGLWVVAMVACVAAFLRRTPTRRAAPRPNRSLRRAPFRPGFRSKGTPTSLPAPFPWRPGGTLHPEENKTAPTRH